MALVVALAGRRVDPADAPTERFPLRNAAEVQERLSGLFAERDATALVSSAACGADLLALAAAEALGLRRRVVLPFEPERFRRTSVTDRPGSWGAAFDRVVERLGRSGDLIVLENPGEDDAAYAETCEAILEEALQLAGGVRTATGAVERGVTTGVLAVIAWDGKPRSDDDLTARFAESARARGFPLAEVSTL